MPTNNQLSRWYKRPTRPLVAFMFFLSGACGLVYEVAWGRILVPVVGCSTEAVTAVLSAFMGGLCIGSYLAAKWGDRVRRPIFWYGVLQIAVGLSALFATSLFPHLGRIFVQLARPEQQALLHAYRFTASIVLMLVPTAAMGATLPVLSRYVDEVRQKGGGSIGLLYGINTLGATIGVLLAGFVLLAMLGTRVTASVAVVVNIGLGLLCTALFRNVEAGGDGRQDEVVSPVEEPTVTGESESFSARLVPVVFCISGMCAMGIEVIWTRLLIFFLSSSTYVFSAILATLLACMGIGSIVGSRIAKKLVHPEMAFAISVALLGAAGLASLAGALAVPHSVIVPALNESGSRILLILSRIIAAAIVVMPSALLMGVIFPFAVAAYVRTRGKIARQTGTLCYANTFGAMLGPIVSGIVLVPLLGSQLSLTVLATVLLTVGAAAILAVGQTTMWKRLIFAAAVTAIYGGLFVLVPGDVCRKVFAKHAASSGELIAIAEGRNGVVTVHKEWEGNALAVNGLREVPPDLFALQTFRLLGHLPMMFHPQPREVLTVAFGSGIALGAVLCWPIESVECVEICEEVPSMAGYFEAVNNRPLDDKRVHLTIDDARNYLLRTKKLYDVITSDATHPRSGDSWVLYTKEYYELCRDHLKSGGIMAQWVPMHGLPGREFERVLATFNSVFPHCALFAVPGHCVVIGSLLPIKAGREEIETRIANPRVRESLEGARLGGIAEVMSTGVCGTNGVRSRVGDLAVNTDDLPYAAFAEKARTQEKHVVELNLDKILEMQSRRSSELPTEIAQSEWEDGVSNKMRLLKAYRLFHEGKRQKAYDAVAQLRRESPGYGTAEYFFSLLSADRKRSLSAAVAPDLREGIRLAREQQFSDAAKYFEKALKRWKDSPLANLCYGACLMDLGDIDKAEHYAERAVQLDPNSSQAQGLLMEVRRRRSSAGD